MAGQARRGSVLRGDKNPVNLKGGCLGVREKKEVMEVVPADPSRDDSSYKR